MWGFRYAVLAVTNVCNMRCLHCGFWKTDRKSMMGIGVFPTCLDKLRSLGVRFVDITGGEPLLHPNLKQLVRIARNKHFVVTLSTNGSQPELTAQTAREGVTAVYVSLDHYDPESMDRWRGFLGSHERACRTIELCRSLGINTSTSVLLSETNISEIGKVIEYSNRELRCPVGICFPTEGSSQYPLNVDELPSGLLEAYRKIYELSKIRPRWFMDLPQYYAEIIRQLESKESLYPCYAGKESFYMDWSGRIYSCFRKDYERAWTGPCTDCLVSCFVMPSMFDGALRHNWVDLIRMCIHGIRQYR